MTKGKGKKGRNKELVHEDKTDQHSMKKNQQIHNTQIIVIINNYSNNDNIDDRLLSVLVASLY